MAKITESVSGKSFECPEKTSLLQTLLQNGILVDNPCNGMGTCGKCRVAIVQGSLPEPSADEKVLLTKGDLDRGIRLACQVFPTEDLVIRAVSSAGKMQVLSTGYMPEFTIDPNKKGLGLAVDIGTTTLAASLIDLSTGDELALTACMNDQRAFGQDVLTRITYEMDQKEEGIKALQKAAAASINHLIEGLCLQAGADPKEICSAAIAANCTMTHMLLGEDARSIGVAPYRPRFLSAQVRTAEALGLNLAADAKVYCLPQVSGYIGGDILAGAYVCSLKEAKDTVFFIDIGTNGEMVLARNGRLFSCSCAAGPALEGMNISCGMSALEGAIEQVCLEPFRIGVIGNADPKGICGSGILEVLSELLRTGMVKPSGAFVKKAKLAEDDWRRSFLKDGDGPGALILAAEPELLITQQDVRQVQLAKGAILSGFLALLDKAGLKPEDIDRVLVAGQFGSHLSAEAITGAGLLPPSVKDKISYVGNTSKTGARMALLSEKVRTEMEALAGDIEYFELAEWPGYQELFVESMRFA